AKVAWQFRETTTPRLKLQRESVRQSSANKSNSFVTENPYSPTADSFTMGVIHRKTKSQARKEIFMRAIRILITNALLVLAAASFSVATARADTYSWTNLQSDIAGVAAHVDPNLVNPWGVAVSPSGIIWVSDNGTGVSTLYHQDGTALSLVVTIPTSARNKDAATPVGWLSTALRPSK